VFGERNGEKEHACPLKALVFSDFLKRTLEALKLNLN
jgi:hypothetical protein